MLRMSRLTDYGIVLLAHLAAAPDDAVHNARELAERARLPLPVVSKILKHLAREGFLHSQRGAKGGYALAQRPEEISVAAVIDALEGPIALTDCGTHPGACDREASCVTRAPWQRITLRYDGTFPRNPGQAEIPERHDQRMQADRYSPRACP